jgi:hypothetical protein
MEGSLEKYFKELGYLHDARIEKITWTITDSLSIEIDDLNSNFLGLPEYTGIVPATLVFEEISKCVLAIDMYHNDGSLDIYELLVKANSTYGFDIFAKFSPSGNMEITCKLITVQPKANK